MICTLIRHGADDGTLRGGWSASPLTDAGVEQARRCAARMAGQGIAADAIYTSDLPRARQTADILAAALGVPVRERPCFREANNGVLAGMDNALAAERYPGLFWNTLDWEQRYPGGESPREFYERIAEAWQAFKEEIRRGERDVILVTHGGVISAIRCMEAGLPCSNKSNPFPVGNGETVEIAIPAIPKSEADGNSSSRRSI